jgi:synaptojanin
LWETIIIRSLCKNEKYICVTKKLMVGCFIMLFIKDKHKYRIGGIKTCKVKTGFAGNSGNKGSVALRFVLDDTSFLFMNCHLASGQKQVAERLEDLKEIYKRTFDTTTKYYDFLLNNHDYKFIFGDLNFRVELPDEVVRAEIRKCNYSTLWARD